MKLRPTFVATSNLVLVLLTETYDVLGGDITACFAAKSLIISFQTMTSSCVTEYFIHCVPKKVTPKFKSL